MSAAPEPSTQPCYRHPDRKGGVRCQRCDRAICPQCMRQASVGFHCPECTQTGKQKVYTRANLQALNRPVVTQVLVAINVVVFLLGATGGNGLTETGGRFFVDGALFGPLVAEGEWWRLITSGFLHANLLHLALNMILLFQLGGILEPAVGRVRFAAIYFTSLLCGSFGVMLLDPNSPTVGASGAVFGLMGALFVAQRARGVNPWASGIGPLLMINLFLTFGINGISIGGHLGGLAGGLASAAILYEGPPALSKQQALGGVIALGAVAFVGGILLA